ncbi:MAG: DUF4595 domain-containing protein [Muribaculaceae bacterium]|nr:DUF4595 domain-containing protein [Muribaculaceae bacterium]
MKRYFHSLAATMILILPLASCDKDNNGDDPTPNPNPNPTPTPTSTAQLSSLEITEKESGYSDYFAKYIFQYDESNKIKSISESGNDELTDFSWNPFSMTVDGHKINVTLSSAGYLTRAQAWSGTESTTFEYDNKGYIVREICEDIDFYEETIYTWKDNLLVEILRTWKEDIYTGKELATISYSNDQNKTGIWPASFWECELLYFEPSDYECTCILQTGLLGVAPTLLPASITIERKVSNNTSIKKYNISTKLDSEGRLSSETIESVAGYESMSTYNLKYTYR